MISLRVIATVLLTGSFLVGCAGPNKPKPASLQPIEAQIGLRTIWSADLGGVSLRASGQGAFAPAVSGGLAVAANEAGIVRAFDLVSGAARWSFDTKAKLAAAVGTGSGSAEGFFAVVTQAGELILLDQAGSLRWRIRLGGVAHERPVITGSVVTVRLADNRLTGWSLETGKRLWVVQRTLPSLVLHGESGVRAAPSPDLEVPLETRNALGPGDLIVALPGGRAMWVNGLNGAVRWESQVLTPRGSNEVERLSDILGAPEVLEDRVCLAAYQNLVACLANDSGRILWQQRFAVVLPVAADPRFIFAVDASGRVVAYARQSGNRAWQNEALFLRGLSAPVSFDRAVWVADFEGFLHGLSREDGKFLARQRLAGGKPSGPMQATRHGLLIQTHGGQLMLLQP